MLWLKPLFLKCLLFNGDPLKKEKKINQTKDGS